MNAGERENWEALFRMKQGDWLAVCKENDALTAQLSEAQKEVERLNRLEQANFDFIKYQVPKSSVCVNLGEAVGFLTAEVGSLTALLEASKVREKKLREALVKAKSWMSVSGIISDEDTEKKQKFYDEYWKDRDIVDKALAEGKGEV